MPLDGLAWLFVEVETDDGAVGVGECSNYLGNPHLARGLEAVKPLIVGADARRLEEIWQRLFRASRRPGLGIELDYAEVYRHRVDVDDPRARCRTGGSRPPAADHGAAVAVPGTRRRRPASGEGRPPPRPGAAGEAPLPAGDPSAAHASAVCPL
jgi:hypothetical protein